MTDLITLTIENSSGIALRIQQEINRACGTPDHDMHVKKNHETKTLSVNFEHQVNIIVNPLLVLEQLQKLPEGTPTDDIWEAL